ncbi:hypothetical protein EHW67_18905 [Arenibacter aquaticus]|uniref:Uncharacterized protein n=1 Tax=Arenibacter aquaticus TaxID=2489054 RepID=A0A3S0ACC9_9FLAO|nr:hypothetical protein [Arenibacter aquaticus]RTE52254.1 hypothetical protein EHW67_18905 [Arenibacter aquaticus]
MKTIFIILFATNMSLSFGQISYQKSQPGIFKTYVNFLMNDITLEDTITVKKNYNRTDNTFRLWNSQGKRIKEPYAVSDGKHIYFRANSIKKYFTNKVNEKLRVSKNGYFRAICSNEKYIYIESFFHSMGLTDWRVGTNYRAGIIYNISKGTFTVFYTIEDLNSFLKQAIDAEMSDEYLGQKLSMNTVWFAMNNLFDDKFYPYNQ